jgi:hypothetical protein
MYLVNVKTNIRDRKLQVKKDENDKDFDLFDYDILWTLMTTHKSTQLRDLALNSLVEAISSEELLLEVYWIRAEQNLKGGNSIFIMLRVIERLYLVAETKYKDNKFSLTRELMDTVVAKLLEYQKLVASQNIQDIQYVILLLYYRNFVKREHIQNALMLSLSSWSLF